VSEEMDMGRSSSEEEEEKGFLDISTMLRSDCEEMRCDAFIRSLRRRGEVGSDAEADAVVVVEFVSSSSESQEDDGDPGAELDGDGRGEARKLWGYALAQ
jgi:hypothetical protein